MPRLVQGGKSPRLHAMCRPLAALPYPPTTCCQPRMILTSTCGPCHVFWRLGRILVMSLIGPCPTTELPSSTLCWAQAPTPRRASAYLQARIRPAFYGTTSQARSCGRCCSLPLLSASLWILVLEPSLFRPKMPASTSLNCLATSLFWDPAVLS